MKKAFITGITGTVAPYLKKELQSMGYEVFDKHYRINEEKDLEDLKLYLNEIKPDVIFHLALGPISFAETLALYAKENNIKFSYISTVSVFEDNSGGPYNVDTVVTVKNEYGKYKYECEQVVKVINLNSYIVRIGWQISEKADATTNNMFRFIKDNLNDKNEITVSDKFYPSASLLPVTVRGIVQATFNHDPGLYFVNSNNGKSLYEILHTLKEKHRTNWIILKDNSFSRNDIMLDSRIEVEEI